jgi:hypothetical protein
VTIAHGLASVVCLTLIWGQTNKLQELQNLDLPLYEIAPQKREARVDAATR